ncbi:flexible cuticle protein 12-like [Colletes latitarsis]|uniref:flexible cuticle protein 12-like n=1 Tax=Colletes latitarsis TaxID=2605962 RepID=UPI0040353230
MPTRRFRHRGQQNIWAKRTLEGFVVFAFVVAVAYAAPQGLPDDVVLVKETPSDNIGLGAYNFGYELSNGQSHQETADVINAGTENQALAVRGTFSWVDPQTNVRYTVNYVADENGFHPQGEHIPA